jgi:chaperonin GroEL
MLLLVTKPHEGTQLGRGYLSPHLITNTDKMVAEKEDDYIFLREKKLSFLRAMLPVFKAVVQTSKPLQSIAEDTKGEALGGGLKICAVKADGFGDCLLRPCSRT